MTNVISRSRKGSPYQYLRHVWQFQFAESKRRFDAYDENDRETWKQTEGWEKFKAAGFIFLAFWLEAYFNYVLKESYSAKEYELLEKSSPKDKLKLFKEKYNLQNDISIFSELFHFRNDLAHGKWFEFDLEEEEPTKNFTSYEPFDPNQIFNKPYAQTTRWEQFLLKNEKTIIQAAEKLLDDLQNKSNVEWHAFGLGEISSFSSH